MTRTPNACFNVYTIVVASIALAITRIDAEHSDARSPRHRVIASLDNGTTLMTRTLIFRSLSSLVRQSRARDATSASGMSGIAAGVTGHALIVLYPI
jgi:hypothetical protein